MVSSLWRNRWFWLPLALIGLVVVLDRLGLDLLPVVPALWLPVLLAAALARPPQVALLALAAFTASLLVAVGAPAQAVEPAPWPQLVLFSLAGLLALGCSQIRARREWEGRRNAEHYRLLAEYASDVVFRLDPAGRLQWISASVQPLLGWDPARLIGAPLLSLIHPDDHGQVEQGWLACSSADTVRSQYRVVDRQGQPRWVSVSCRAMRDGSGTLQGRIGSWSDAEDQVRAREQLLEQRQLLETILDNVDSHVYLKDRQHRYLYANRQVQQMYGRSLEEIVGRSDREFFSADTLAAMWAFDEEVFASGSPLQREEQVPTASGEERWFLSNKLMLQRSDGACLIGFSTDITERRQTVQALERSERTFRLLFEMSLDAIVLLAPDGRVLDANPAVVAMYGAESKSAFLRLNPQDFSPDVQPDGQASAALVPAHITRALEQGSHQFEWQHRRLDNGETFLALVTLRAIHLNGDQALLAVVRDISESRRYEERLRQLAYRDALTGLPNRAASLEWLQQALATSGGQEGPSPAGLLVVNLDFDSFQAVNDSFGLEVGNRVLLGAAAALSQVLRAEDWLARLESDEFLVVRPLRQVDQGKAQHFAVDLQRAVAAGLAGQRDLPIRPSLSAGVAWSPDHGQEPVALLQAANTALMDAKRHSQKAVQLYHQDLSAAIQQRLDLELKLERAIERQQFHLLYQPQVNGAGELVGAEALLRWTLADGQAVSPDVFIPLAEQTGLIHPIGDWVIETACSQLAQWRRQGLRLPRLAINLSAVQFERRQSDLDAWLMAAISRHGISPVQLELEVTETALLAYPDRARGLLYQLGAAGFCIAIDDFGTGYSSLAILHTLPVHQLKIDKSFVQRIHASRSDLAIVDASLVIAKKLGLRTVAEGVETQAQWQTLRDLGCDSFQGYWFGRPMPAEELAGLLRRGTPLRMAPADSPRPN